MQKDIENLNYEKLNNAEKIEFGTILETNVNTLILQLIAGKEEVIAQILSSCLAFKLNNREDLSIRFAQFGQELIKLAMSERQRELINAQILQGSVEKARQSQVADTSDIPIETGESKLPVIEEPESNN